MTAGGVTGEVGGGAALPSSGVIKARIAACAALGLPAIRVCLYISLRLNGEADMKRREFAMGLVTAAALAPALGRAAIAADAEPPRGKLVGAERAWELALNGTASGIGFEYKR